MAIRHLASAVGTDPVQGLGFMILGFLGFKIQGLGFKIQDLGFRSRACGSSLEESGCPLKVPNWPRIGQFYPTQPVGS